MGKGASVKRIGGYLVLLGLLGALCAQMGWAQLAWDPKEFMGVDEITPGMTGYGKTVYQGTNIEKFDIEVIGVLKKIDFGFDMILIKVTSGPVVDRKLQTVAGMSGSPIYIDDRLIGAYAYGWDFQQEAIAGVTPIASMLECSEPGSVTPPLIGSLIPNNRTLKIGNHLITQVKVAANTTDAKVCQASADPTTMVLAPVATPLMVSGINEKSLPVLQKMLDRYNIHAVEGPGPGQADGPAPPLEPGSAVAVSLMEGDANMTAVGTVTYVKGNTVLAFGHPFMGIGKVNLPMASAYVHGIVNSSQSSFKLASPMERVGALTSDRQFAVAGTLGQTPATLPVTLYLTDASRKFARRYSVNLINHPDFSPMLLYMWIINNGAAQMGDLSWAEGTFAAHAVIVTDKLGNLDQKLIVAPKAGGMMIPFAEVYLLADLLMSNPYEPVELHKIYFDLTYTPERNTANIEKVTADRPIARPGETITLSVKVRPYGKPVETLTSKLKIPEQATESAMIAIVAGGTLAPFLKPLYTAPPTPEEGLKGIVRLLTDNPSAQSMITAQVFPTPSYGYHGNMLRDLPMPLFDVLRSAEAGVIPRGNSNDGSGNGNDSSGRGNQEGGENSVPTTYMFSQDVPYVLTGGQMVYVAIDSQERAVQAKHGDFDFSTQMPILSTSLLTGKDSAGPEDSDSGDGPSGRDQAVYLSLLTPQQRARYSMLTAALQMPAPPAMKVNLPRLNTPQQLTMAPLSLGMLSETDGGQTVDVEAKAPTDGGKNASSAPGVEGENEHAAGDQDSGNGPSTPNESEANKVLLTKKHPSWGLTGRKDFVHGRHIGTGVSSQGNLMLVPSVRSVFQTNDFIPWKLAVTTKGTYIAGWGSSAVRRLTDDGKSESFFPKQPIDGVEAITALVATPDDGLLIGTWPDQHVRQLAPDGAVTHDWVLPGDYIWDLRVLKDGRRLAACDGGVVLELRDDANVPVQALCEVPDKHVVAMASGPNGDLYMSTSPRGKVFQYTTNGELHSVYDSEGAIISLCVDDLGNIYVGTSPTCRVIRISPDGNRQEILRGMGRGNRHVFALQLVGNDLYAATGPAGGIYRISKPTSATPEVTAVFAREDLRIGTEETDVTGPESVMVTDLALTPHGDLLAAASTPGQVLKLEPRTKGTFLSTVLQTPVVARWGQLEQFSRLDDGQTLSVESRSGYTATPDQTWSEWAKVDTKLTSPPATFAQFRVSMTGTKDTSPTLSYVRLYYQPINQAPQVRIVQPKAGAYWSNVKDIRWEGHDAQDNQLAYSIYLSRDNGKSWSQMKRNTPPESKTAPDQNVNPSKSVKDHGKPAKSTGGKPNSTANSELLDAAKSGPANKQKYLDDEIIDATSLPWDTRSVPDGTYMLKVVASNKYAQPDDPKQGEAVIGPVVINNTLPAISLKEKAYTWDDVKRFTVVDDKAPLLGGKFCIDDGPWTALVTEDGIFHGARQTVLLVSPSGEVNLAKGEHKLTIEVVDAAGNILDRTINLAIGMEPPKAAAQAPVQAPQSSPSMNVPPVTEGPQHEKDLANFLLGSL